MLGASGEEPFRGAARAAGAVHLGRDRQTDGSFRAQALSPQPCTESVPPVPAPPDVLYHEAAPPRPQPQKQP